MTPDEQSIRELIAAWHRATAAGDVARILQLMSEDVVFLGAGRPPMRGRQEFESGLRTLLRTHRIESQGDIQEIRITGDMAYSWTHLTVLVIPLKDGAPGRQAGDTLTILHKGSDGKWLLVRDANMLAVQS